MRRFMRKSPLFKCLRCIESYNKSKNKLKKCRCGCKVFLSIPKTMGSNLLFTLLYLRQERKAMEKLVMKFCRDYSHFKKPIVIEIEQLRRKF